MANLTLVIDDDLLRRARIKALQENTSVNAVVREQLARYADNEDERSAAAKRLLQMARNSKSGSGPGGRTWTRDELYER